MSQHSHRSPPEVVNPIIDHDSPPEVVDSTVNNLPDLPSEVVDYIIDHLEQAHPNTLLKNCCLVSKSWVPRSRKHLFREIRLDSIGRLKAWKETFPVPEQSPAHFVHTLLVDLRHITAEYVHWIQLFTNVVKLIMWNPPCMYEFGPKDSIFPFPTFSSTVKSLVVYCKFLQTSEFLCLVHSFPLLEDLGLSQFGEEMYNTGQVDFSLLSRPPLTGTLLFRPRNHLVRSLLDLPGGLHLRKIVLGIETLSEVVGEFLESLVEKCSGTLECVDIDFFGRPPKSSIDLSRAAGLKEVVFRSIAGCDHAVWVSKALNTIKSRDLKRVSLCQILRRPRDLNRSIENCCLHNMEVGVAKEVAATLEEQWSGGTWKDPIPSLAPKLIAQFNTAPCKVSWW